MRVIVVAAMLVSLTGAAHAQALNLAAPDKRKDPVKEERDAEIDRAYRDATQGKNAKPVSNANDPWGSVRAFEQPPKPAPKQHTAAKPKVQAQSQPQVQSNSPWPPAPTQR